MRKSRFTARQILSILDEAAAGAKISDVCGKHEISVPTFYLWKSKYRPTLKTPVRDQLDHTTTAVADLHVGKHPTEELAFLKNRVAELERENNLLRNLFIELSLKRASLEGKEGGRGHSVA
jgi:transposase-like protein